MDFSLKAKKVFVAMSGGVDSSVAALLLKERGFEVCGVHIKMWSDPEIPCTFKEDRYDAMRVAAQLDIPFATWDFTEAYREGVVDYMVEEYAAGRTPNPDVMCNRKIKFGVFLARAKEQGADFVATGHYVRQSRTFKRLNVETFKLLKAVDNNKDQSYFLWTLGQDQLRHCLFPIGEYTKPEVREMARKFGLPTAEKKDSQGICFIGEIDVREFLKKHIFSERGPMVTEAGKLIGEHEGLAFYTLGQRKGIGIGGGIPYYVTRKDFVTHTLHVAEGPYDENLFSQKIDVEGVNWILGVEPELPLACAARIRYRQVLAFCRIEKCEKYSKKLQVIFDEPQRASTPGQSIVFYQGEEVLGGGIII